jgi:hypothetical protein
MTKAYIFHGMYCFARASAFIHSALLSASLLLAGLLLRPRGA